MRVHIYQLDDLSRLSWALLKTDSQVEAWCGRSVKIFGEGLYEGGWAGAASPFDPRALCFGSGFQTSSNRLVISTPSHTCEGIYTWTDGKRVAASNSLAFLFALCGLDSRHITTMSGPISSAKRGIYDYARLLYSDGIQTVSRYLYASLTLEGNQIAEKRYPTDHQFATFSEYRSFLERVLSETLRTSGCCGFAAYVSKGYDSVACAALMKRLGRGVAISIAESRRGVDDSGEDIAKLLGHDPVVYARRPRERFEADKETYEIFTEADIEDRYEFYTGTGLTDECLSVDTKLLENRVVLTGFHGDKIWNVREPANNAIKRGDGSGSSLYEFRLRTGFVHIPVPLVAATAHADLLKIGQSDEMAPWRLDRPYDRPIARRLAEEEGVPREMFGQTKQAAATMSKSPWPYRVRMFEKLKARYHIVSLDLPVQPAERSKWSSRY